MLSSTLRMLEWTEAKLECTHPVATAPGSVTGECLGVYIGEIQK
jgi:hypothetical protein